MNNRFVSLALRKLISTFVTSTIISIVLASFMLFEAEFKYNLGNQLMGGSFLYNIYIGAIVLVYGNAVSIALENAQKRWFKYQNWIYILLHGLFGLANGLFFPGWILALSGVLAAFFYAIIDRWVFTRALRHKSLKMFFIVPILIYGFTWVFFQTISPSMPPFTKEDAVEFATSGEGTIIDNFPKKIGKTEEKIGDYKVVRETEVEEVEHETYIVTFTERWSSQVGSGNWYSSYKVQLGQLTAYAQGGANPPYR